MILYAQRLVLLVLLKMSERKKRNAEVPSQTSQPHYGCKITLKYLSIEGAAFESKNICK